MLGVSICNGLELLVKIVSLFFIVASMAVVDSLYVTQLIPHVSFVILHILNDFKAIN